MHTLHDHLLRRHSEGRQGVVFVEESQGMPIATLEEIRACMLGLKAFKESAGLFYSVVDTTPVTEEFVAAALADLRR